MNLNINLFILLTPVISLKTLATLLMLDVPKRIIEKYKDLLRDNRVFPVPSNNCCNTILKKIGVQCGIKTRLTYHVTHHNAATAILLSHGVPIETVSRILGHTNIKTTQIYARITNQKISRDMNGDPDAGDKPPYRKRRDKA